MYQVKFFKILCGVKFIKWSNKENWQFQNWQFLKPNFGFPNYENSGSGLTFQFKQFQKFAMRKFPRISNLKKFKNCVFEKIPKIVNLQYFKNI